MGKIAEKDPDAAEGLGATGPMMSASAPLRITFINQFYTPDISPTAHLTASLAEHRAARGDQVTVVTSRGGYVKADDVREEGGGNLRIHRIWTPQLGKRTALHRLVDWGTFYLLAFWRVLVLPRQDLIVSLTTPPYIAWSGVFHKLLHRRTKLILWNMDCYPDAAERTNVIKPGGILSRFLRFLNRALFRRLDHLICLDTAMVDLLISQYGPRRRTLPTTIIPNWERASFFPPGPRPQPWQNPITESLRGRFVVLYLGNTGYGHEFDTMLSAAEALRNDPVTFLFVGGGSRWAALESQKRERGLENVILQDYIPKEQTPAVMGMADCALITLQDAALGVMSPSKLHANLAMGLPILYVGPSGSNVDDAIQRFGCGVSVRRGDVEGMVAFIRGLLNDEPRRVDLRRRAREAFDQAYCDMRTLPAFDRLFDRS